MVFDGQKGPTKEKEKEKAIDVNMGSTKYILIVLTMLFLISVAHASISEISIVEGFKKIRINDETAYTKDNILSSEYLIATDKYFYGSKNGIVYVTVYLNAKVSKDYKIGLETHSKNIQVTNVKVGKNPFPQLSAAATNFTYNSPIPLDESITKVTFTIEFDPAAIGLMEEFDIFLLGPDDKEVARLDPFLSGYDYRQPIVLNTDGIGLTADVDNNYAILIHIPATNTNFWNNHPYADWNGIAFTATDGLTELDFNVEGFDATNDDANIWVEFVETFESSSYDTNGYLYYGGPNTDNSDGSNTYPASYTATWHFNETSGNAIDSTSNSYDLTHSNTPTQGADGIINKATSYDRGSNEYSSNNTLLDGGLSLLSYSLWVKKPTDFNSAAGNLEYIASKANSGDLSSRPELIWQAGTGSLLWQFSDASAVSHFITSAKTSWAADTWFHIVVTIDATDNNIVMFVDGSLADGNFLEEAMDVMAAGTQTNFFVNISRDGVTDPANETLDEFKVFVGTELSIDEAKLLYYSESDSLVTFGAQEVDVNGVTSSFSYTTPSVLDPENGINSTTSDLNDTSTYTNTTPIKWYWLVDDVNVSDLNIYADQNITYTFNAIGDYNVCLDVFAEDYNNVEYSDMDCQTITVSQNPQSVSFNWDVNSYNNNDANVVFTGIATTDGVDVEYWWIRNDTNYLSTDVNTSAIFNNVGDQNICFVVNDNDSNKQACNVFATTAVTVKIPLDEADAATTITPFSVYIYTNPAQDYNGVSIDTNFFIFDSTPALYTAYVDTDKPFYGRYYDINSDGTHQTVQPYLSSSTDGVSTKIVAQSNLDLSGIPNVTVRIFKQLPTGRALVEVVTTDAKGEALISGLTNELYEFEVYYLGSLIAEAEVTITSTTIYIRFNPLTSDVTPPGETIACSFDPAAGKLSATATTLQQIINLYNTAATAIDINAIEGDGNRLYTIHITSGITGTYTNTITIATDLAGWDENKNVEILVEVYTSEGIARTCRTSYSQYQADRIGGDILAILRVGLRADFGCPATGPCGVTILIATFITIILCGSLIVSTPLRDPIGVIAASLVPLGFFVWINWVPFFWYILYFFFSFFVMFISWRIRG